MDREALMCTIAFSFFVYKTQKKQKTYSISKLCHQKHISSRSNIRFLEDYLEKLHNNGGCRLKDLSISHRGATAGKAHKAWALPRFWVSIRSYKKQPVKNIWDRILGLAWLKFAVAPLNVDQRLSDFGSFLVI